MGDRYYKLVVWKDAFALAEEIYRITDTFPPREKYGLSAQLRCAAISIPSNIAEGYGRVTAGERRQFLGHARGSAFELHTQLLIATRLALITDRSLIRRTAQIGRMLTSLLRSTS